MKALFIYEKLDFERGIDPKQALDIGLEGKLKNVFKKISGLTYDQVVKESGDPSTVLHYIVMASDIPRDEKFKFIKYLVEVKKASITSGIINASITNKAGDDITLYLISNGDPETMKYITSKMKIKESQNFERGQDPRDSMKIGIRQKRSFKTVHECAEFFIKNIQKLSEGRFKDKEELIHYFEMMDKTKKDPKNVIPPLKSPLRMSKDYLEGFKETDNKGNTLTREYPPMYIEEWGTTFDQLLQKLQGLRDFHVEIQKVLGIYKMNESVNFERGIDPKEAIGVGQEELNKKRAKDIGDIIKIPEGIYRIYLSGFFGRSKYRTVKDTGKDIFVSKQWAEKFPDGFEAFPKELEEMNKSYRKRNPNTGSYFYIDPEEVK